MNHATPILEYSSIYYLTDFERREEPPFWKSLTLLCGVACIINPTVTFLSSPASSCPTFHLLMPFLLVATPHCLTLIVH
jgi:hypothetical protein